MTVSPTKQEKTQKRVPPQGFKGMVRLMIPAYTANIKGLMINIAIIVNESHELEVVSDGHIAKSIERMFKRNIEILSSLKLNYTILNNFKYKLISMEQGVRVRDVRSAGLPITIALLNILRMISGNKVNNNVSGTGILRADGSFSSSTFEHIKREAAKQSNQNFDFATTGICHHVFDLEALLGSVD